MSTIRDVIEQGTALYNKGDVDGFCALYSDDVVLTTPHGRFAGRETVRSYVQGLYDAFPSGGISIGRHCENGDLYFGEFMLQATNTGPIALPDGTRLPATHRSVDLLSTEIARVENGVIVQHEMFWDELNFLRQLGLMPPG